MRSFLVVLGIVFSTIVFAESEISHFDKLKQMYEEGIMPSIFPGDNFVLVGRCYLASKPNRPVAAGNLIYRSSSSPNGPISKSLIQMGSFWNLEYAPDAFDKASYDALYNAASGSHLYATEDSEQKSITSKTTKNGGFVINLRVNKDTGFFVDKGSRLNGKVLNYCYYFRKVFP